MATSSNGDPWQLLPVSKSDDQPRLFYSCTATSRNFELLLTDLIYVWSRSMDYDEILREALDNHCSIDPSESTSQFKTLLAKLRDSLHNGCNVLIRPKALAEGEFELQTTLGLPAPLRPLNWTFKLERLSSADYARHLSFPCLKELSAEMKKLNSLMQVIKEKDHVITKLLDKIEGSAIDLGHIFPGITGLKHRKHYVSVSEASKHVPGMATFDKENWTAANSANTGNDVRHIQTLSGALAGSYAEYYLEQNSADWLRSLPRVHNSKSKTTAYSTTSPPKISRRPAGKPASSTNSSEDDFETQRTSISAAKEPQQTPSRQKDGSSTDSDSDAPRKPVPKATKGRLGTIGKSNLAARIRTDSPKDTESTASPTASNSNSDCDFDSDSRKPKTKPEPKSTSKLGKLGGKKKPTPSPTSKPGRISSPNPPPTTASSTVFTPSRKLGVLGGHKKQTDSNAETPARTSRPSADADAESDISVSGDVDLDSDATASASSSSLPPAPVPPPLPKRKANKSASLVPQPTKESESAPEPSAPSETGEQAMARRREELKRTLASAGGGRRRSGNSDSLPVLMTPPSLSDHWDPES